jgi:hypothetical protein
MAIPEIVARCYFKGAVEAFVGCAGGSCYALVVLTKYGCYVVLATSRRRITIAHTECPPGGGRKRGGFSKGISSLVMVSPQLRILG